MKRTHRLQIATVIFISLAALLALNACSGVLGGQNVVRVYVPELAGSGDSRHVSMNATYGYVIVVKKDKVYSANKYSYEAYEKLVEGNANIANLPEGDYIFGVALMDDAGANYGLAIKEVTIQPGFNDVPIVVGPGITTFDISGLPSIDNPLWPSKDYSVKFAEDTVIIDYGRSGNATVNITFDFGDSTVLGAITATDIGGDVVEGPPYTVTGTGLSVDIGGSYTYRIILK
ncbi:MAG: hypothetical protein P1P77_06725 [Spirochaetaceae bacterium]|nr:hypothetical protein [Spirochaetaceae bacterium]